MASWSKQWGDELAMIAGFCAALTILSDQHKANLPSHEARSGHARGACTGVRLSMTSLTAESRSVRIALHGGAKAHCYRKDCKCS